MSEKGSGFTPGPWRHDSRSRGVILGDSNGISSVEVAEIPFLRQWQQGDPVEGSHATFDRQRANARLIAEAPAMFALLEAVESALPERQVEQLIYTRDEFPDFETFVVFLEAGELRKMLELLARVRGEGV